MTGKYASADCRGLPATESPEGTPALLRVSPMSESATLREQAERCRRLARESIDPELRDSLLRLAEEYAARADAQEACPDKGHAA